MQVIYTSHDMGKSGKTHTALWPYLGMIEGSWGCQEDRVQVAHLSLVSFSFTVSLWNPHDRFQDSCPLPLLQLKILWFNVLCILICPLCGHVPVHMLTTQHQVRKHYS